jgi:hypothetical protein
LEQYVLICGSDPSELLLVAGWVVCLVAQWVSRMVDVKAVPWVVSKAELMVDQ